MGEIPSEERKNYRFEREQSLVKAGETFMWVSDDLRQKMVETFKETNTVPKEQAKHYLLAELGVDVGEAFREGVVKEGKPEEALANARQALDALAALEDSSGKYLEGWKAFCARKLKLASKPLDSDTPSYVARAHKENLALWKRLTRVNPVTLPEEKSQRAK